MGKTAYFLNVCGLDGRLFLNSFSKYQKDLIIRLAFC